MFALAASGIAQDGSTKSAPTIPEEARKHFVMGTALFKDAKSAEDFDPAAKEFQQAADLAPEWPEASYNLALSMEAAGRYQDYHKAIEVLNHYIKMNLSEEERRKAQDKIYQLQAEDDKQNAILSLTGTNKWSYLVVSKVKSMNGAKGDAEFNGLWFTLPYDTQIGGRIITITGEMRGTDIGSIKWSRNDQRDKQSEHPIEVEFNKDNMTFLFKNIYVYKGSDENFKSIEDYITLIVTGAPKYLYTK